MKTLYKHCLLLLIIAFGSQLANAETISLKFNNHLDETIYITTSQFGGDPSLIEKLDLTKKIEIKQHSSGQVFLFDDAPWLMWSAQIKLASGRMHIIDSGKKKLNKHVERHIIIDINPPKVENNDKAPEQKPPVTPDKTEGKLSVEAVS